MKKGKKNLRYLVTRIKIFAGTVSGGLLLLFLCMDRGVAIPGGVWIFLALLVLIAAVGYFWPRSSVFPTVIFP